MKSIDETIRSVLEKRDQAEERREKRNEAIKKASVTAACVLAALLVAVVYLSDFHFPSKSPEDTSAAAVAVQVASDDKDPSPNFGGNGEGFNMPSTDATTAAPTAAPVPESESGTSYGGEVTTSSAGEKTTVLPDSQKRLEAAFDMVSKKHSVDKDDFMKNVEFVEGNWFTLGSDIKFYKIVFAGNTLGFMSDVEGNYCYFSYSTGNFASSAFLCYYSSGEWSPREECTLG